MVTQLTFKAKDAGKRKFAHSRTNEYIKAVERKVNARNSSNRNTGKSKRLNGLKTKQISATVVPACPKT